jgi:hypothetical protein
MPRLYRFAQPGAQALPKAVPVDLEIERRSDAARYLAVTGLTIIGLTAAFMALLWVLDTVRIRPPPAFTNSHCFDAKLEFLRQQAPKDPTHLIVGSSIAWRNIDSNVISRDDPGARVLNGGFCGLSINQSAFVGRFLLQRFPGIRTVLVVIDPFDMSACRSKKTAVFDGTDVSAYLSGAHEVEFYFKYFDLFSLLANAFGRKEVFTRHGDGPLETDQSHGLVYGPAPRLDPACLASLASFADAVTSSGRGLLVVTMPLHAEWSAKFDPAANARGDLADAIRQALAGTTARFFDGWSNLPVAGADFTDAVHLRWTATTSFTHRLLQATGVAASNR